MRKWIGLAVVLGASALKSQTPPKPVRTGAQLARFHSDVDDSDQPYALYVPKSLAEVSPASGKKYPLVVFLHAEDSNHRLGLRMLFGPAPRLGGEGDTEDMRYFPPVRDVDYLAAAPLARGTMGYQGIAERDVYDMLADIEKRFPVDPDRVYLTGVSMGGSGALWLALTRPDVWAAVAPVCPQPLPDAEELAGNALDLPVRLFHGEQDPLVPVASTRNWQRRLMEHGVPAEYVEYPGIRHNAWDLVYRNGAIFDWFTTMRRNRFPEHVHFTTQWYRHDAAYWVRLEGLTPGTPATIDAAWKGQDLAIQTQNIDGFTVTLGPAHTAVGNVTIDGAALRVRYAPALSFVRVDGKWRQGKYTPVAKRPGAEGPISEAVSGRQIYVYGSGGARTDETLEARKGVAETAAAWSTTRSRLSLVLPVKADTAVTAADLDSANLVLFGTAETNSVIARLRDKLPLSLSAAAADYGLLFIAPVGKHYALVNSGLPWWTGAEEVGRAGDPLAPDQYRLLRSFGDYVLFKGSLKNVVAQGHFDRNWKLPADAAAKMSATGTVTVR